MIGYIGTIRLSITPHIVWSHQYLLAYGIYQKQNNEAVDPSKCLSLKLFFIHVLETCAITGKRE